MKKRVSFTLIELLIVIAIIAILASLLLPALQRVRVTVKNTQCRNNLRQMGIALFSYSNDFKEWGPQGYTNNQPYIWLYSCFEGYYLPVGIKTSMYTKRIVCPGWQSGPDMGYIKNGYAFSHYFLVFGRTSAADNPLYPKSFFGWNSSGGMTVVDGINTMPCPNMKMLGTTVSEAGNTCKFLEPSQQPMGGDIAPPKTSLTVTYYTVPGYPWPHEGSNNVFFDGHLQFTERRNLDRQVKNANVRWK